MKKFLLFLFLFSGAMLHFKQLKAQCDLSFPNLARAFSTDVTPLGPNKCQYTISVQFEILTNSGFKNLFFHSWLLDDYPSPAIFDCSGNSPAADPGTSAQLGTTIDEIGKSYNDMGFVGLSDLTFPADVPVDVTANIATVYPHDPSVALTSPLNSPGMTATVTRLGNSDTLQFSITNLRVIVNTPCGTPVIIKTDIWGSNSNAPDPKAQCYVCGTTQSFGNPQIALQKLCSDKPFQYSLTLTPSGSTPLHVVYRLYADDLDGVREPGGDDSLIVTSDTILLTPGVAYNTGAINLPGDFCCTDPYALWGLFVEVTAREFGNVLVTPVVEEACADVLPVTLRTFTATRSNSTILLKWETVTEQNSRGFYIERNLGANKWQTLGFVTTRAVNGNSNSPLAYTYTDINDAKGIIQYRLRQVDYDGKHAYSQIRAVRAPGQKLKTIVYPNPSADGKVSVVFPDTEVPRDVFLADLNGRIIKQWKGIRSNYLQIDNLMAGFYTIRIIDAETGEQSVEKVVVKKR